MGLLRKGHSTIAEILWSDAHVGEKKAILYPDPYLDYRPNKWQQWLFDVWSNHFIPDIEHILDKWKPDYDHATSLGDMGSLQYKHGHPTEFWAHTEEQVAINTGQLFDPIAKLADDMHFVHGNDAHIGPDGKLDHLIAKDFDNAVFQDEKTGLYAHSAVDLEFQGLLFNYTHKGKNRTKWTTYNGLTSLSAEVALQRTLDGERVPDVLGRGHFHWAGQLQDMRPLPFSVAGWKVKDAFTTYIDHTASTPHVGGQMFIIQDGEIVLSECLKYKAERNKPWTPKL